MMIFKIADTQIQIIIQFDTAKSINMYLKAKNHFKNLLYPCSTGKHFGSPPLYSLLLLGAKTNIISISSLIY